MGVFFFCVNCFFVWLFVFVYSFFKFSWEKPMRFDDDDDDVVCEFSGVF